MCCRRRFRAGRTRWKLTELTELGLLVRSGQGRGTRYGLAGH